MIIIFRIIMAIIIIFNLQQNFCFPKYHHFVLNFVYVEILQYLLIIFNSIKIFMIIKLKLQFMVMINSLFVQIG